LKEKILFLIGSLCLLLSTPTFAIHLEAGNQNTGRELAVTFDDLPVVSTRNDLPAQKEITTKLLKNITASKIPAIGFVNEVKLYQQNRRDEEQIELLRMWLAAGLELGNHTYSHLDLHVTPLEQFENDVLQGEIITRELTTARSSTPRFFRHPFLHTGMSQEIRQQFEEFLRLHGYRVAPVTIDNSDWIFARAYDNAFARGDKKMMKRIGDAYVPYMERKLAYFERQSLELFGRDIHQVLLLHANSINAEYFGELVRMMKRRGYRFISLEQALADKAYQEPDKYTGTGGISWLHRWALTKGVSKTFFAGEPATPAFVMKAAGVSSE
jgi:peptidoglycan/xylan/chitin deacetylase (PgdA/CDA1 family)